MLRCMQESSHHWKSSRPWSPNLASHGCPICPAQAAGCRPLPHKVAGGPDRLPRTFYTCLGNRVASLRRRHEWQAWLRGILTPACTLSLVLCLEIKLLQKIAVV